MRRRHSRILDWLGAAALAALILAGPQLDRVDVLPADLRLTPASSEAPTTGSAQPFLAAPAHAAEGTTPPAATGTPSNAAAAKGAAQLRSIERANSTFPAGAAPAGFTGGRA